MLFKLKKYLQQHQQVNLMQVSQAFQVEPSAMHHMLNHWIRQGSLQQVAVPIKCGQSCQRCAKSWAQVYRWQDPAGD